MWFNLGIKKLPEGGFVYYLFSDCNLIGDII